MFRQFFAKHFGENSAAAGCVLDSAHVSVDYSWIHAHVLTEVALQVGWQDSIACSSEAQLQNLRMTSQTAACDSSI